MDFNHSNAPVSSSLERRLERIEHSLDRVEHLFSQLTEQKDAMLGMAGDVLDRDGCPPASRDERVQGVAELARELTEPQITEALRSALKVASSAQGGLGLALDALDQAIQERPQLPEQFSGLLGLLNRVCKPETLNHLHAGLDALDQAPSLAGTMLDLADQQLRQWLERNQEEGGSLENVAANVGQLIQWLSLDSTSQFLRQELGDSSSMPALTLLADSVRAASQRPPEAVGLFKGARKLGHSDAQYALGFVCDVVEHLGRSLSQRPSTNLPVLD